MQRFYTIFLVVLLGGIIFISPYVVLAIATPDTSSFTPACGEKGVSFVALNLVWDDVAGIDHYELYYRKESATAWTDRYPIISKFNIVGGLQPKKEYIWYVVSCGDADCSDSGASGTCSFTTMDFIPPPLDDDPPPDDGDGGDGGDGDGDDGDTPPILGIFQIENPISSNTLPELITKLLNFIFGLSIVIAPLMILYAGFLMLTAAGDATKLQKARTILVWTVIAFAIILVAKGAPNVIRSIL